MTIITQYPAHYINTTCCITERVAPMAFRGVLPNGKLTIAFLQKDERHLDTLITPESCVCVRLSPSDFDRARIMSLT